jgi:hypothetical protein
MNAIHEHHKDNIRFGYHLLRPAIDEWPNFDYFQQPERVIGFFTSLKPVVSTTGVSP